MKYNSWNFCFWWQYCYCMKFCIFGSVLWLKTVPSLITFLTCCCCVEKCCHVQWGQEKLCYTVLACFVFLIKCTHYFRVPLRTSRRKSVRPPSGPINNNGDISDASDMADQSPQNSITSINSISSLLKEKLAVSSDCYQNLQESW